MESMNWVCSFCSKKAIIKVAFRCDYCEKWFRYFSCEEHQSFLDNKVKEHMHNVDWDQFEKFLNAAKDLAKSSKYGMEKLFELYKRIKEYEKEISELLEE
jgi:hypothetical protein